jgi:hypothetical protein
MATPAAESKDETSAKPEEGKEEHSEFETPDELFDITLIVEDKKLYAHKTVLGLKSPVFRQMFSENSRRVLLKRCLYQEKGSNPS